MTNLDNCQNRELMNRNLVFRFGEKCHQLAHLIVKIWALLICGLLFFAFPGPMLAHDSTKAVEVEIGDRERYQELTDQVAPVFTSFFIVIFMVIFYYWRRRDSGISPPIKPTVSTAQEKLE